MKNVLKFILCAAVIITLLSICGYAETHYTRKGKIITVECGVATIEDTCGNLWEYKDENLKIGDKVVFVMYNNLTEEDITDDEIVKLKIK